MAELAHQISMFTAAAVLVASACDRQPPPVPLPSIPPSPNLAVPVAPIDDGPLGFRIDGEPVCLSWPAAVVAAPAELPPVEQPPSDSVDWRALATGVEYTTLALAKVSDDVLHVVRVDPARARLRLLSVTTEGGHARTAAAWCDEHHLVAVINAGMFQPDVVTHTGYLRVGDQVNSATWQKRYNSLLLLDPRKPGLPSAAVVDLDPQSQARSSAYGTVVQNMRLIRGDGQSSWKSNSRKWSEALIAEDRRGRILLVFSRRAFTMSELNRLLLASPLGLVRAMHAEGGPEASLSIRAGDLSLDLTGSFETGFNDNDDNRVQWPLPSVLGVEAP